jgi:hypothetical protein
MAEGSHHDSYLWQRMREVVERSWASSDFHILADTAFPVTPANPVVVRPLTESELRTLGPGERTRKEQIASVLKSIRSAAEWGNASLQNAFPGVKKKIRVDDTFMREKMMRIVTRLYNLRVRRMAIGQIGNTFI